MFHRRDFRETPSMAFLTREAGGYKSTHDFHRQLNARDTRAETQHVAIVMFA